MKPFGSQPLITLTTDFGLADHYAGSMKGVILSGCPGAKIIDISHEVAAFSLYSGAYTIDQAAPYYPAGAIHVVVIDPGVGTARRAVLLEALGQYFVAPDNGVLSMIAARAEKYRVWEIKNQQLWRENPSKTFHGRDVFAPVAAALASGVSPSEVGPVTASIELLAGLEAKLAAPGSWQGKVLSVDRFGNIITNLPTERFRAIATQPFELMVNGQAVSEWNPTFGAAKSQGCFVYFGSSGYVEVGMNQQSAALLLRGSAGDSVTLNSAI